MLRFTFVTAQRQEENDGKDEDATIVSDANYVGSELPLFTVSIGFLRHFFLLNPLHPCQTGQPAAQGKQGRQAV